MWHLLIPILYLTYSEAQHYQAKYPVALNNEHVKSTYPYRASAPAYNDGVNVVRLNNYYPSQRLSLYDNDPYYNGPSYNKISGPPHDYYSRTGNNLQQSNSQSQLGVAVFGSEPSLSLDYTSSDSDTDTDPKSLVNEQSYFEDIELVENFGNYLKKRTQLDGSSSAINDATRQYNALLSVLIGLAKVIRNSCIEFDQIYDHVYLPTVDTYYKYGLANAEKVAVMIEGYVRKGNSHIPKLRKLKKGHCEKELLCSVSFDIKIKSSPLLYVKELETLEALAYLARNYYPFIEEFNQAAQNGNVLSYLQNSKERLKEYVMHIVNSVEHLTDKVVLCP